MYPTPHEFMILAGVWMIPAISSGKISGTLNSIKWCQRVDNCVYSLNAGGRAIKGRKIFFHERQIAFHELADETLLPLIANDIDYMTGYGQMKVLM